MSAVDIEHLVDGLTMEHFDEVEVHHGRCVLVSDIPAIIFRLRERLAQEVETLDTHYDYTSGSHVARIIKHPSQIRAEAMSIVRGVPQDDPR